MTGPFQIPGKRDRISNPATAVLASIPPVPPVVGGASSSSFLSFQDVVTTEIIRDSAMKNLDVVFMFCVWILKYSKKIV